ncbi:MAG: DMT family transporter [Beijerinckiaceae bacterium]
MTTPLSPAAMTGRDYALYATAVFCWGASWLALRVQVAAAPPETAVFWRFVFAVPIMAAWVLLAGKPWRFGFSHHLRFLVMGLGIFSTNFILYYHGGKVIISGLLPVLFSLAVVGNLLLGAVFLGQKITFRLVAGALIGVCGVALMFWPEFSRTEATPALKLGVLLCLCGTVCFCFGNIASALASRAGVDVISASAWGMAYGTVWTGIVTYWRGESFAVPLTLPFVVSFLWLLSTATIIAFAAYLTLVSRIGPARAGYASVMYPVVGLFVSSVAETLVPGAASNFVWTPFAVAGIALAIAGNVLVLKS